MSISDERKFEIRHRRDQVIIFGVPRTRDDGEDVVDFTGMAELLPALRREMLLDDISQLGDELLPG